MSNDRKTLVTPTGKIVFLKNLFTPDENEKYKATLILDKSQDLSALKQLMIEAAKSKFDESVYKSKKFKWGLKTPDEETIAQYDFYSEETMVLNASTKFEIDVKGNKKGPDGKFETLIDGDLKAGDYCRFLIGAYPWEMNTNKGVSFNVMAIQMVKEGEALYARKPSDSFFDEVAFDVEPEVATSTENTIDDDGDDFNF